MKPIRVLFFGDSICVGQHVSIHAGWVTSISAHLAALGAAHGREIVVTNASGNGRTTREALERMPYEVQSQRPHIVLVQFGMNDCNHWQSDGGLPRVSPGAFAANLAEIVLRARVFGARSVILNTNHPTALDSARLPHSDRTFQQSNHLYNERIRAVAEELGEQVRLNDIEGVFERTVSGNRERLLELLLPAPDLLHLSIEGHRLYFDATKPIVEDAVQQLLAPESP